MVSDTTSSVDAGPSDEEKEPRNAKDARKMSFAKLERELEKASENEERLVEKLRQMKQAVIEREYKLRKATRKAEHNHRAYIITQLQLDLLSDENYVLIHGKQPPLKHSDKAAKRNLSIPTEEPVELLNEGGAIDLIGVGTRSDEPFDPVEEEAKIQAAESESDEPIQTEDSAVEPSEESSETVKAAKPAKKSAAKKKTAKKTAKTEEKASKPAKKAKKPTKKAAKPAKKAEKKVEAKDAEEEDKVKTTRLRKGGRTKTQASAPPRPEA